MASSTQQDPGDDRPVDAEPTASIPDAAAETFRRFRFFPLKRTDQNGDRFLMPWLICQMYGHDATRKGRVRQARRELCRFFEQDALVDALKEAGDRRDDLLREAIFDSANVYLTICRDDDQYGRKLFGLIKMKAGERENKVLGDVYRGILPLLAVMEDFPLRAVMAQAVHEACLAVFPQCKDDIEAVFASFLLEHDRDRRLFPQRSSDNGREA